MPCNFGPDCIDNSSCWATGRLFVSFSPGNVGTGCSAFHATPDVVDADSESVWTCRLCSVMCRSFAPTRSPCRIIRNKSNSATPAARIKLNAAPTSIQSVLRLRVFSVPPGCKGSGGGAAVAVCLAHFGVSIVELMGCLGITVNGGMLDVRGSNPMPIAPVQAMENACERPAMFRGVKLKARLRHKVEHQHL